MRKYTGILTMCIFNCWLQLNAQFNRLEESDKTYVESKMAEIISDIEAKGAAIGIVVDGDIAYLNGFGYADKKNDKKANYCTLFRTASICKPLTEILAVMLDDAMPGFSISDPVKNWLPDFPPAANNPSITVDNLMDHTSGLSWDGSSDDAKQEYIENNPVYNAQAALEMLKTCSVYSPAQWVTQGGTASQLYSTVNYMVLGAVLEKVSGKTYQELMKLYYTNPFNMHTFQPEYTWMTYSNKSKGYDADGDLMVLEDISHKLPGGGFIASVADLSLFMKAYINNQVPDDNGGNNLNHTGRQEGTYTYLNISKTTR